jgi:putative zinc finger protein
MDHSDAVRLKATERYLLNELDPEQLDQFEEHLFDCPDCALDVRAAAMLVEQSKNVFSRSAGLVPVEKPAHGGETWLSWLRPTFAVPVMAALIAFIAYQNLVSYPRLESALHRPQVVPWASVNVGTWGAGGPVIQTSAGQGFLLFVRIPPDSSYTRYTADLYNPAGKLEWTLHFAASPGQDQWPMHVPAANREAGTYSLAVHGVTAAGESKDLGRASFELQTQK